MSEYIIPRNDDNTPDWDQVFIDMLGLRDEVEAYPIVDAIYELARSEAIDDCSDVADMYDGYHDSSSLAASEIADAIRQLSK